VKTLNELVEVDAPSWPVLLDDLSSSFTPVEVLPPEPTQNGACLLQLQVSARSPLGAVVLNSGGLLLHGGWIRVFGGSGSSGLPSMAEVNRFPVTVDSSWRPAGGLVLAHDVLGGVYAINGVDSAEAGRPGAPGEVVYFSPQNLQWSALEMGHSAWLGWLLADGPADMYELWPNWRSELAGLRTDQGISFYPFLWSSEAQEDIAATTRKPVSMNELLEMHHIFCEQMGTGDPGFLGSYPSGS
jgi:hypothetical protein